MTTDGSGIKQTPPGKKKRSARQILQSGQFRDNLQLWMIMLPTLILIFIFAYIPIYGLVIAFQNYSPGASFLSFDGSTNWVGLTHFTRFFEGPFFGRLFRNTLVLSLMNIVIGFPIPILFALLLNEVRFIKFRKIIQTASYLPYFISMVVVANLVLTFIRPNGLFNEMLSWFGVARNDYSTSMTAFPWVYTVTNIWKSFGFSSILYLSAISAIDPELYESARLDGAGRWKLMRYITLPGITGTVAIMFIFAIGSMLASNRDLILLLYKPAVYETADVIDTYIYRIGIEGGRFDYTTAIGLVSSVINFALVFGANKLSTALTGQGIW